MRTQHPPTIAAKPKPAGSYSSAIPPNEKRDGAPCHSSAHSRAAAQGSTGAALALDGAQAAAADFNDFDDTLLEGLDESFFFDAPPIPGMPQSVVFFFFFLLLAAPEFPLTCGSRPR
jgi:hypothetical protein